MEYPNIEPTDFDIKVARICFVIIKKLYEQGATKLTPVEIDQEVEKYPNSSLVYKQEGGLEFIKTAYEFAELSNFELYFNRLKKTALLRRLKKDKYDISSFYVEDKDISDPLQALKIQEHFEESSIEEILNEVESKYNIIRNDFLNGGKKKGDPSEGIFELIEDLRKAPNVGPELEGKIFSGACRGARQGCFYLKSASTNAGKTRTSVFDACKLAYPERWSEDQGCFIYEIIPSTGEFRASRKVLFIVTEMDKEELQTIMLAYLSGVNEEHILTGRYELGELSRVKYAAKIMEKYNDCFIIEEISDPNLTNIEATIKKYATIDNIKYCFFDYIHTTASMMNQFSRNSLREDVVLMMMANQLKQLAKDYNIFIFSATQVNATAMIDDGEFKNETCIRGAKSIADKADVGYVMTKINEKTWNTLMVNLKPAIRSGIIDPNFTLDEYRPTHVLDIYKMRRGRYKNVRIWTRLDLGCGRRKDLFITSADNQPFNTQIELFNSSVEHLNESWRDLIK